MSDTGCGKSRKWDILNLALLHAGQGLLHSGVMYHSCSEPALCQMPWYSSVSYNHNLPFPHASYSLGSVKRRRAAALEEAPPTCKEIRSSFWWKLGIGLIWGLIKRIGNIYLCLWTYLDIRMIIIYTCGSQDNLWEFILPTNWVSRIKLRFLGLEACI